MMSREATRFSLGAISRVGIFLCGLTAVQCTQAGPAKLGGSDRLERAIVTVSGGESKVPMATQMAVRKHLRMRLSAKQTVEVVSDQEIENAGMRAQVCRDNQGSTGCWLAVAEQTNATWILAAIIERLDEKSCSVTLKKQRPPDPTVSDVGPAQTTDCAIVKIYEAVDTLLGHVTVTRDFRPLAAAKRCEDACTAGERRCGERHAELCEDGDWDGCLDWSIQPCNANESCSGDGKCVSAPEGMARIGEGRYQMGSNPEQLTLAMAYCERRGIECRPSWWRPEQPAHWIALGGYWIDTTEVTQAAYNECVAAGKCTAMAAKGCRVWDPSSKRWVEVNHLPKVLRGDNFPAICVDWEEAKSYCAWKGKRLPTEAEWEKAARGLDGRLYPWGNNPFDGSQANGCDAECAKIAGSGWTIERKINDGARFLSEVGHYKKGVSPYGLYDMTGNVWEWVNDWFDEGYYAVSERQNPRGPAEPKDYRVVRGGSWSNESDSMRAAFRYSLDATTRMSTVGFRCAFP